MNASATTSSASSQPAASKRRALPIEEAIRWAVRDELPKRRDDGNNLVGGSYVHPMWGNGLFTRVNNWSREPGMPPAMGECHPDAERIETAIAALKPDELNLTSYRIGHGLGSECKVETAIAKVRWDLRTWIVTLAVKGRCPDLGEGPLCEAALGTRGQPTIWKTVSQECGAGTDGMPWFMTTDEVHAWKGDSRDAWTFCKLHWTRTTDDVAEDRARYAVWHAALTEIARSLASDTKTIEVLVDGRYVTREAPLLDSLVVKPPIAPATPWIEPPPALTVRPSLVPAFAADELDQDGDGNLVTPRRISVLRPLPRPASPVRHIDPALYPLPIAA